MSGTRADFGKLEPLARTASDAGHKVTFFVTGMHTLTKYGLTKQEVHHQSRFSVTEFINQRQDDPPDIVLAKTMVGFSDYLQENVPDLVIIHGDRVEAVAAALVCATNNIRSAHVEGGEVSGTIDEVYRHCNTKLCTYHLVSSPEAAQRIQAMGEERSRIKIIGSPELDVHGRASGVSLEKVLARYEIATRDYGIAIFHPVTSERATIGRQAETLFATLAASKRFFVVIMPNNDPGASDIEAVLNKLPPEQFRTLPSMRFAYFSELMKHAKVVVGNSSVGVREAPFLGVPSLDIGTRQTNRAASPSIHHCEAQDVDSIRAFLESSWGKKSRRDAAYGHGTASEAFKNLLEDSTFWEVSLQKTFVDNVQEK